MCFTAASLGLFLGAWFLNLKRAQSMATVLMLTIMLTGGFFVRSTPSWMDWTKYISYIMYGWAALVKIHLRDALGRCEGENASEEGICDYGTLDLVPSTPTAARRSPSSWRCSWASGPSSTSPLGTALARSEGA